VEDIAQGVVSRQRRKGLLMITEVFLPEKGGTAVSFDDDFRRLGGKEVHIITKEVPGAVEFDRGHPNTIHRLCLRRHAWIRPESAVMYGKLFLRSLRVALGSGVRAVFAARALPEGLVAWAVGRLVGKPVLTYAHGEEFTTWGMGGKFKAMRFALRHADWVLPNSEYSRQVLIELLDVDPARIALCLPTVDEERFQPGLPSADLRAAVGLSDGQRLVLSVGRLKRRKGFDNVIRALPALVSQGIDVHYALIGIGEDQEYLEGLVRDLGVAERVHFLGHVSYEELPRWYGACDLFAMPNREVNGDTEGFGLVFLEAAASGKPAVAGRAGGTGSAVVDGETGLRVDGEDVEAIARAIGRLLADPQEAKEMGRRARERVLKSFTHAGRVALLERLALS
jgi:phosphatidylinositol alpha-1,6-mannosyltransferase